MQAVWWAVGYGATVLGFAWLALALDSHWEQVRGSEPPSAGARRLLQGLGSLALLVSLIACLRADHASMAALLWIMLLAAGALTVAMTLAWRPRWLKPLARVAGASNKAMA